MSAGKGGMAWKEMRKAARLAPGGTVGSTMLSWQAAEPTVAIKSGRAEGGGWRGTGEGEGNSQRSEERILAQCTPSLFTFGVSTLRLLEN